MRSRFFNRLYLLFSSPRLTVALLIYATVLVFVATLAQREIGISAVQSEYFESFLLLADFGVAKLPLPGGAFVGIVAFFNIFLSGIRFSRFGLSGLGVSMTHMALALLILSGALQYFLRIEGSMRLFPATQSDSVVLSGGNLENKILKLPFTVRLKKFTEEKWEGSSIAKSYSSDIVFERGGKKTETVVSMNNPASYGGWTFYQMSYGRDGSSVLSAVKNPARLLPWLSVGAAFFGMVAVFLPRVFSGRGKYGK